MKSRLKSRPEQSKRGYDYRMPWQGSRVRQEKHAKAILGWFYLIYPERVKAMMKEQMFAQLERNGQLDTLTPATPSP